LHVTSQSPYSSAENFRQSTQWRRQRKSPGQFQGLFCSQS